MTPIITAVVQAGSVAEDNTAYVPWWSYTKTVLAAASLVLVSQNRLHLDEPVEGRPFTLRQLLQHRAGLVDYGPLAAYHKAVTDGETPWPVADLLQRVGAETIAYEPGQGWGYSNVGYLLVRGLVEQTVGASLDASFKRLVFEPLGIVNAKVARFPGDLDATAWGNATRYHPGWVYHGLLIGTASSAALLLHRLLAGALLPASLLAAMRTAFPLNVPMSGRPWKSPSYGLGLMCGVGEPPEYYIGHTGGGPGSTAAVYQASGEGASGPGRRTVAVFAPLDAADVVERRAMLLAHGG